MRYIRLYPIVVKFVKYAEEVLPKDSGTVKRHLVEDLVKDVVLRLEDTGAVEVPGNLDVMLDELIEQAVELIKGTGTVSEGGARAVVEQIKLPAKRRGRKPGSKNKPKPEAEVSFQESVVSLDDTLEFDGEWADE